MNTIRLFALFLLVVAFTLFSKAFAEPQKTVLHEKSVIEGTNSEILVPVLPEAAIIPR